MTAIREEFSDVFIFDLFGIITGTAGVTQMPNIPCNIARFKTLGTNTSPFYLGHVSGTVNLPFPMDAGDDTGWFATTNLNRYYFNAPSGTAVRLAYWIQR